MTDITYNVSDLEDGRGRDLKDSELYENIAEASDACERLNRESGTMGSRGTYGTT